ncbi:MAG: hypothetical protein ABSB99_07230 [Acidimicrobiales bacterium]
MSVRGTRGSGPSLQASAAMERLLGAGSNVPVTPPGGRRSDVVTEGGSHPPRGC